jgi:hypothetical protein
MMDGANVERPRLCGQIVGEGSRPRDPSLPKPSTFYDRGQKYTLGLTHVFTARGDARPPGIAPLGISTTFLFPT